MCNLCLHKMVIIKIIFKPEFTDKNATLTFSTFQKNIFTMITVMLAFVHTIEKIRTRRLTRRFIHENWNFVDWPIRLPLNFERTNIISKTPASCICIIIVESISTNFIGVVEKNHLFKNTPSKCFPTEIKRKSIRAIYETSKLALELFFI